uniref:Uncharacterized protein n=1 Tax=Salix viminalis TaxID=40686 RepID=A0A6N2LJW7_SALVM
MTVLGSNVTGWALKAQTKAEDRSGKVDCSFFLFALLKVQNAAVFRWIWISRTSFEQTYRCYPASFIEKVEICFSPSAVQFTGMTFEPHIESGDKIIMPPSALDRLASLHIDYPMLFELRNAAVERVSHCGNQTSKSSIADFLFPDDGELLLQEGDIVRVKNVTLPKGKYVKLQPHTKDFLDISNPKAILETTLRNYSCLTTGDSIMVAYNNKKYYIDIVETKPSNAISIIETDCEVDFAPPLDYKEPEKPVSSVPPSKATSQASCKDGCILHFIKTDLILAAEEVPTGLRQATAVANGSRKPSLGSISKNTARQSQGKLVFGSNASRSPKETQQGAGKETKQEQPKKEEKPKFQAFSGKKYSLKG